jgi:spore coat protein CotH
MTKHKHTDKICCIVVALTLVVAVLFMNGEAFGIALADRVMGYENRLFDQSRVHTIDIVMDDWDGFIETCTNEEYALCSAVIDGESYKNIGIRAKGNTSLSSVAAYGNDRYSFKIEFDQYDSTSSYYGLDKLCLNNIIQDNTYLKDYLTYTMMNDMGVASPLCSFVWMRVNGEDWGLYLAVEGVEESFLQRNFGNDYGELYKPDSMNMGGGRGNGRDFNMEDIIDENGEWNGELPEGVELPEGFEMPEGFDRSAESGERPDEFPGFGGQMPEDFIPSEGGEWQMPDGFDPSADPGEGGNMGGAFGGRGSADVMLQYVDDDPESYSNIFGNAKTDITDADITRLIESLETLSSDENPESAADIEAVIRYLVVHDFVQNGDSYTGSMVHNYYLYENDGALSMIPWDYNLAFGSFSMGGGMGFGGTSVTSGMTSAVNAPIDSPVSGGDIGSRPMISWIFENEEYTELYHQIYAEFIAEYFDSGCFEQMLSDVVILISPYVEKEPAAFCTYEEYTKAVSALREFCLLRAESVSGQLAGTIPSTQDGQTADSSTLIDASHISSSDMGSMGIGGGGMSGMGGRDGRQNGRGQSENTEDGSNVTPSEKPQMPDNSGDSQ